MSNVWRDVVGAYAETVKEQKKLKDKCTFSLAAFDDKQEIVEDMTDINKVSEVLKVKPRGYTALYDAICLNIDKLGEQLSKMKEKDRPAKVLFLIQTDGFENASTEFTIKDVQDKIEHQRDAYKWQFMFLGASEEALVQAKSFGIGTNMSSTYSGSNFTKGVSSKMLQARSMEVNAYFHDGMAFSDSEKLDLNK
jgi:hypothetical protein